MKTRHLTYSLVASLIWLLNATSALAETPDCVYTGRGEIYDFDGNHRPEQSFNLRIERFKVGPGQFMFNETKEFSNGFKSSLMFSLGWYVGNFAFDDGAGRVIKGRCLDYGYCVGKNEFPDFKGTFVTRFNSREILTTTTTDDLIVDEVVRPESATECPFN